MTRPNLLTYRIIQSDEINEDAGQDGVVATGALSPKDPIELINGVLRGMQGWSFDEDLTVELSYKGKTTRVNGNGFINGG